MTTPETKPQYLPGSIESTEFSESTSTTKFHASFNDGVGIPLSYYGVFLQKVPSFKSSKAELHGVRGPTNNFTFVGTLGPDKIQLNFDNGSSIEGGLDRGIDESIEVSGKSSRFMA